VNHVRPQLGQVFVELADTLVDDFDVADFVQAMPRRCVEVLGIAAVGLLVADAADGRRVTAASSEPSRRLQAFELRSGQGPGLDCFASGQPVSDSDLPAARQWPRFAAMAVESGFRAVHVVPLRLRTQTIGALTFLSAQPGPLDQPTLWLGQALADVATIGLLQYRASQNRDALAGQRHTALERRVVVERATGVLAERLHVDTDKAFAWLCSRARRDDRALFELAHSIVVGARPDRPGGRGADAGTSRQLVFFDPATRRFTDDA
jgi:GAF domain-containing protein